VPATSVVMASHMMVASAVPAMPTSSAAPAVTAAEGIAAPVKARSVPTSIVPTVVPSSEKELNLLSDCWQRQRCRPTRRNCLSRSRKQRSAQNERRSDHKLFHSNLLCEFER
jgi:hypothetical protein